MKKHTILVAALALLGAACDMPTAPADMDPQFSKGRANPHFSGDATLCVQMGASVACQFKLVGLGKSAEALLTLQVDARETYACQNPVGKIVRGHGERVRVGSAMATFRSDKNGSIANTLVATAELQSAFGSRPCPTGHSVVESSLVVETLSQLSATGENKGGTWVAIHNQ